MYLKYMFNFAYQNLVFLNFAKLSFYKFADIIKKEQNPTKIISEFTRQHNSMATNYSNEVIKRIDDDISDEKKNKMKSYAKSLSFNLDADIDIESLSNLIEKKIFPEIVKILKKMSESIDKSSTYKLFSIPFGRYLIENYELSLNILLNMKKLCDNENAELSEKLNYYIDYSLKIEQQYKKLEETKNLYYNENQKLKKNNNDLTLQKNKVEEKNKELDDKIELFQKNEIIINTQMKVTEDNYKKCKEEKEELKEKNNNLLTKNIIAKWDILSEKKISVDYKKKIEHLLNINVETIKVLFDHNKIDKEMQTKISNLEKEISQNKIELDNALFNNRLLNSKVSGLLLDNQNLKIKLDIEKTERQKLEKGFLDLRNEVLKMKEDQKSKDEGKKQ